MDITNIILYQILGCLKAFKNGHYRYNENASFSQNVKDYIFRHHITYGTSSDYVDQLEKYSPTLPPTKDQLDAIIAGISQHLGK